MLDGALSCDVDTLASIYKGYGLRRPGGYTCAELRMGLENFSRFLERFRIKATLFMVGNDFHQSRNIPHIRAISSEGHEIANHTLNHIQGFRLLGAREKEAEISGMEEACLKVTNRRPVGFRSPGWNISDDTLPILKRRGYLYDASVFPSFLNPLLKALHWRAMRARSAADRTTLGNLRNMLAPIRPYRTRDHTLSRKGNDGIIEFPTTVLPVLRIPFFATFLLATGLGFFKRCYNLLKSLAWPIQYQFHLSDFVDYGHPDLKDQVPGESGEKGVYIPLALKTPLREKQDLFLRALDIMASDYAFTTLAGWAEKRKDLPANEYE